MTQPREFQSDIALRILTPHKGVEEPSHVQIVMRADEIPFPFVLDTPDPVFLERFAVALLEGATALRKNALNAKWEGKHIFVDASTAEVSSSPAPTAGESE